MISPSLRWRYQWRPRLRARFKPNWYSLTISRRLWVDVLRTSSLHGRGLRVTIHLPLGRPR